MSGGAAKYQSEATVAPTYLVERQSKFCSLGDLVGSRFLFRFAS